MNTNDIIILARRHLGKGEMQSSARLCFSDALSLYEAGDYANAKKRAIKSLAYSVGMFHEDYAKASR